jgi:hypothetical protein
MAAPDRRRRKLRARPSRVAIAPRATEGRLRQRQSDGRHREEQHDLHGQFALVVDLDGGTETRTRPDAEAVRELDRQEQRERDDRREWCPPPSDERAGQQEQQRAGDLDEL